jgi:hypothetical protein
MSFQVLPHGVLAGTGIANFNVLIEDLGEIGV